MTTNNTTQTAEKALYWNNTGKYEELYHKLFEALVPSQGNADTDAGEIIRISSKFYYEWYNNGNCNATETVYSQDPWGEDDDNEIEDYKANDWYQELADTFSEICDRRRRDTRDNELQDLLNAAENACDIIAEGWYRDQEWRWDHEQEQTEKDYETLAETAILAAAALAKIDTPELFQEETEEDDDESEEERLQEILENPTEDQLYDFLIYNGVATGDEINLVTNLDGYTVERLNAILFARAGYRSAHQAVTCEPRKFEIPETW